MKKTLKLCSSISFVFVLISMQTAISAMIDYQNDASLELRRATYTGQEGLVESLLSRKADVHEKYEDGFTPLHVAAERGFVTIVTMLLKAGADKNSRVETNVRGLIDSTLLADASLLQVYGMGVTTLLKECTYKNDTTPLHLAAQNGHESVVATLLNYGADVRCEDGLGRTPLTLTLDAVVRKQKGDVYHKIIYRLLLQDDQPYNTYPLHAQNFFKIWGFDQFTKKKITF